MSRDLEALRAELLGRVESIREILADTAEASEAARAFVPEAVAALEGAGLLRLNVPQQLGGWEAPPATQMEVVAALAEIDAAAGWSAMVSNNSSGFMGAYMSDEGVAEVFAGGTIPICAGVAFPSGKAVRVDGGYSVSGYWRLCSGVHQAAWLRLGVMSDESAEPIVAVVPRSSVRIHDTWHVLGLRGTGSADVSLDDELVPSHRTVLREERQRGGGQYRLTGLRAASYEHAGIALGLGRRALRELAIALRTRAESRGVPPRDVVSTALGRLGVAYQSSLELALASYRRDFDALQDENVEVGDIGSWGPAVATYATDVARECIETAFRYAGTLGLYQPNVFERLLRDIHGVALHIMVQDEHYTELGSLLAAVP